MCMYVESNGYKFAATFTIVDVSQIYIIAFACYCKLIDTFVIVYSLRSSSDLSPIKTMLSYSISSLVCYCVCERAREREREVCVCVWGGGGGGREGCRKRKLYILHPHSGSDEPIDLELPNQWLWDIVDEFIYQVCTHVL